LTSIEALLIGAIQGLTEFLPVSSSGHLVILQYFLGIKEQPLTFAVLVHMGTLISVFVAFYKDIAAILRKPFTKLTYLIIVGCIPAGLVGVFLGSYVEMAFESLLAVGLGLIFTGFVLQISERLADRNIFTKEIRETTYRDVIFIGMLQALAIIPGISRSGSTIAAGLLAGLDREFAARYSFLLSIPVILGAGLIELKDLFEIGVDTAHMVPYAIGVISAAIFGLLAIKVVMNLVKRGRLSYFSYYVWILGLLVLGYHFFFMA
jgi:undecaprenyl-diphosphatase